MSGRLIGGPKEQIEKVGRHEGLKKQTTGGHP
jgi:hypothetical protein